MVVELTEELNPEQSVQRHEEEEEDGDVVDLVHRALEYLVHPCFGHGNLEKDPNDSDHDDWTR